MPVLNNQQARLAFHATLLDRLLVTNDSGVPSNADKDNRLSVSVAKHVYEELARRRARNHAARERSGAQAAGSAFEQIVCDYVSSVFKQLRFLRPGTWSVDVVAGRGAGAISRFAQYSHLSALRELAAANRELAAALGNDYMIAPDVVVTRSPEEDVHLNQFGLLVGPDIGAEADLRIAAQASPLLHASISTKWTLRSDRAQNARSEALNLIRNRKGRQPHIVVVTGEPLPSRLASICLGTGDLDCVYHFALPELQAAVAASENEEAIALLGTMMQGRRLKDIASLPVDLAV
jgi:hypothetical protein